MGDSEEDDDYELIEASDVKSVNSEKSSKSNKSWVRTTYRASRKKT